MPDGSDVQIRRRDFPILAAPIHPTGGEETALVYLDSANTSQKPRAVIEAVSDHYLRHNANVARAMHTLGLQATEAYEGARAAIAGFIGSSDPREVVFTKNASEALNLAAQTLGAGLGPGDEVVVSVAEHHSNLVPWQMACERSGASLRWFDLTEEGRFDLDRARREELINQHTRVVAVTAMSNVTGALTPLADIAEMIDQVERAQGVRPVFLADGSQFVPHFPTDVASLGVDLLAFTGHKMLGPTGIGVLWGRYSLLDSLPPFLGGGEMIEIVRMTGSTYARPPQRFEAGTPPIAQAVGLGAAVDYLRQVREGEARGMAAVAAHDAELTGYGLERLTAVPGLRLLGPAGPDQRGSVFAFTLDDIHPHDVMQVLDSLGIAVRGGHHCARPLHERFGVQASVRASTYLYTTTDEIDALVDGLRDVRRFFGKE